MAAACVITFFFDAVFLGKVAFNATGFARVNVFLLLYQLGPFAWLDYYFPLVLIGSQTILVAAWQIHEYCKKRRTEKRLEKKKESRVTENNALTALEIYARISWSRVRVRGKESRFMVGVNEERIIFDREQVFQCCKENTVPLVAVFEAIMDVFTVRNECNTWLCKSINYGKFHEQLSMHFGSRLRYVYLHRDPRDVCLSFSKAPVGEAHYYLNAETWRDLQEVAIDLHNSEPEGTMHQLSYEALLSHKQETLDSLFQF
ncbi:unnamed protein product, partial [Porites evermanni]